MDLYTAVAYDLSKELTSRYSSSFSLASKLYARELRPHIYALYGMVRLADEIVDTYNGTDKAALLNDFQAVVKEGIHNGYSTNPIVHAFALTARQYAINDDLIDPFFDSMRMDLTLTRFTETEYTTYIFGSAEVIGLMCLKIFCRDTNASYESLAPGARQLGSAYQKINFLRDIRDDYEQRGRFYFPNLTYESLDDSAKEQIVADIRLDLEVASESISHLPSGAKRAVGVSYRYYSTLLKKLDATSSDGIKQQRAHVASSYKIWLYVRARLSGRE